MGCTDSVRVCTSSMPVWCSTNWATSPPCTHSHTHIQTDSLSCAQTHTYTHTVTHTYRQTLSLVHKHTHIHTQLHTCNCTPLLASYHNPVTVHDRRQTMSNGQNSAVSKLGSQNALNLVIQPAIWTSLPEFGHSTSNGYQLSWIWSFNLQLVSVILSLVTQLAMGISYPKSSHSTCKSYQLSWIWSVNLSWYQLSWVGHSTCNGYQLPWSFSEPGHSTCNRYQLSWIWSFNSQWVSVILSLVIQPASGIGYSESDQLTCKWYQLSWICHSTCNINQLFCKRRHLPRNWAFNLQW